MKRRSSTLFHSINFEICRICMSKPEFNRKVVFTNIFESIVNGFQLKELILKCFGVEVKKEDNKPKIICQKCLGVVKRWIEIKGVADLSQHFINCITSNEFEHHTKVIIEEDDEIGNDINMSSVLHVELSEEFNNTNIDIVQHNTHGTRSNNDEYGNQQAKHSNTSTEECVDKKYTKLNKSLNKIDQQPLKKCPSFVPLNKNKHEELTEVKMEEDDGIGYDIIMSPVLHVELSEEFNNTNIDIVQHNTHGTRSNNDKCGNQQAKNSYTSTEECVDVKLNIFNKSKNKIDQQPLKMCPSFVPLNKKKHEELTEVKIEEDYEIGDDDINMSSVSNVELSEAFDNTNIDIVQHNMHETRYNNDKYGNQQAKYSYTSTEECEDVKFNKLRNKINQQPLKMCPSFVPLNKIEHEELTEVKMEEDDGIGYDIIMSPVLHVELSEEFNNTNIDIVQHNTHGTRSNNEKYCNQQAKHSYTSTEECVDVKYNKLYNSQNKIDQQPLKMCPSFVLLNKIKHEELTDVKIEEDDEIENGINMSSTSHEEISELSNNTDLDINHHNIHGIRKYGNQLAQHSYPALEGRVDVKYNELNKSQNKTYQQPLKMCPPFVPFNYNKSNISYHGQNVCSISDVQTIVTSNRDEKNKNKRKCVQNISNLEMPNDDILDGIVDENETRYCICDEVAYGTMIACDNKVCITEWYHYGCVGIMKPPRGKWFCPKCRNTVKILKKSKKKPRKTL